MHFTFKLISTDEGHRAAARRFPFRGAGAMGTIPPTAPVRPGYADADGSSDGSA